MGAARTEDAREATATVLGTVLGVNESVSLCVRAWLEVGRAGATRFPVRRVLNGRDEVAEQRLGRRRLDAVGASVRVLERLREQLVLSLVVSTPSESLCIDQYTAL